MKAILLGMNNPLSVRPEHALFPYPPGCSGWRLWQLLQSRLPDVSRLDYCQGFDRINLVRGDWSFSAAVQAAESLPSRYAGRTIVALGGEVRKAIGLPLNLIHPIEKDGVVWRQLPHPSGRNHWFNTPECRNLAAMLLEELYLMGQQK